MVAKPLDDEKSTSRTSEDGLGAHDRLLANIEPLDERDPRDLTTPKNSRRYWYIIVVCILCTALGICLGASFMYLTSRWHQHHTSELHTSTNSNRVSLDGLSLDCGSSDAEAKANGCVFDVMIYAWVPPACYERDLAEEVIDPSSHLAQYRAAGIFEWHAGPNFTQPLPQDAEVLQEYDVVWATMKWHQAHCLYFWRLLTRAVLRSGKDGWAYAYVLSLGTDWPHTLHCNRVLGDRVLPDNDQIRTLKFYGRCQRIDMLPDGHLEHGSLVVDPEAGA